VRYIGNIIKALTTHSGRFRSNSPAIKPDVKVESEMNFGELLANAKGTQRGARINDNSVNEMTIAGIRLKKTRKGKLAFIVDYVVDKSAGKSAGNHADDARTPYPAGNAHIEGTQVSEYIDLTEDWGPGIAKELLLAALGASEKDVTPEQASLLFEKVPRSDKELAPSGANVARGLKLRVDMVSYTTKQGRSRFVANYSQVPQTPDQLAENIARLDKMGVK